MVAFYRTTSRAAEILLLGLTVFTLSNCATIFSSGPDPVSFSSQPDGASIIINGIPRGETPLELQLETNKEHVVIFRRDGYKDTTVILTTHVQAGWVVLDVLAGVIGVAIDAATGEWKAFDSGAQYVVLEPAE